MEILRLPRRRMRIGQVDRLVRVPVRLCLVLLLRSRCLVGVLEGGRLEDRPEVQKLKSQGTQQCLQVLFIQWR